MRATGARKKLTEIDVTLEENTNCTRALSFIAITTGRFQISSVKSSIFKVVTLSILNFLRKKYIQAFKISKFNECGHAPEHRYSICECCYKRLNCKLAAPTTGGSAARWRFLSRRVIYHHAQCRCGAPSMQRYAAPSRWTSYSLVIMKRFRGSRL